VVVCSPELRCAGDADIRVQGTLPNNERERRRAASSSFFLFLSCPGVSIGRLWVRRGGAAHSEQSKSILS
jgi:hypothetical protein